MIDDSDSNPSPVPYGTQLFLPTQFSEALTRKCFPTKESILFNLEIALEINSDRDGLTDLDRVELLCDCHKSIVKHNYKEAAELSAKAGYKLMAAAILLHWGKD